MLEPRLRATLENVALVALALDREGRVAFANDALLERTGWSREEALGRDWLDCFVAEPEREGVRAVFDASLAAGRIAAQWECDLRARDGSARTVAFSGAVLADGCEPEGVVLLGVDVTERRRADEVSRSREELFRTLIEHASDVIVVMAADGTVLYSSPAVERALGIQPEALAGRSAFEVVHPADLERVRELFAAVVAGAEPPPVEVRLRHRDGSWRTVEAIGRRHAQGGETVVVVNYRDVTDQRLLREQLYHAQKLEALGRLAGGIAHDFNNLLTAIGGYADLLASSFDDGDPRREDALEIVAAAQRAGALTAQLLAFSRRQVLETEVLDLGEIIVGLGRLLSRLLGEEVTLVTSVEQGCLVRGDRGQLEQVITNLAVNARDAMPSGGMLELAVRCTEREVVLTVSDTGHGMDAETLAHAFEPFFTTKEPGKGTGLGLATVYGIVAQTGGDVSVASEVGAGTRFRIVLPRCTEAAASFPADEPTAPTRGSGCVLVAEDEETIRRLVEEALVRSGFAVHLAADGPEALALLAEHGDAIDLLLTDVVMPGMSGPELARAAARLRPSLRVLFTSGYAREPDEALADPDVEFIGKPFSPQTLVAKVREVLAEGRR